MTDRAMYSPPMESEAGLTRGFLFADLRGYSHYSEARGDAAAAALLARYRTVVRGVVATAGGAEIRTEGDSFYVVFRSGSAAVRAGLAIVAAAADDAADHPEAALSVGVGIHAGEAIESDEGPIGSAVNIAARICAAARPGEVLVSDTVRSLTRTSIEAQFVSRGKRRLKGIDDPIELFAVGAGAVSNRRLGRRPSVSIAVPRMGELLAIAVLAGVGALFLSGRLGDSASLPGSSATPDGANFSATPTSTPTGTDPPAALRFGELAAGNYVSTRFKPAIHLRIPAGWRLVDEIEGRIILSPTAYPEGWQMVDNGSLWLDAGQVVIGPIKAGWTDCTGDSTVIGPTSQDLIEWLTANSMASVGEVEPFLIANQTAVGVTVKPTDFCSVTQQRTFSATGSAGRLKGWPLLRFLSSKDDNFQFPAIDGYILLHSGRVLDISVVDLQPQAIAIVAILPDDPSAARAFGAMAAALVRTVWFEST